MKRQFRAGLAAALVAVLSACAGGTQQASSTVAAAPPTPTATAAPTPSPTPTPSPAPSRTHVSRPVPDVTGKTFTEAYKILTDAEFYGYPYDTDSLKLIRTTPDKSLVVVSTSPTAGTVTSTTDIQINLGRAGENGKAAGPARSRYEFDCGYDGDIYHSLKEVWASKYYAGSDTCSIRYDGELSYDKPPILPEEQKVVDLVAANGGSVRVAPIETFDAVLRLCIRLDPNYTEQSWDRTDQKKAEAKAALAICPDAPHATVLRDVQNLIKVDDGTHVVGQDMVPGTYRTEPAVKDCYWARSNGGGDIIANNFIGFAHAGVTVTVYGGEGFESQRCGLWTKIG
ncbi:PASTA domain-containing protein [Arthrobacter sp. NPDC058130]|uniref:PASTA domain-containing protein n=1 Tax=Arthrobacter sp. NPDC058130 TaxID=3346353 RepID=UPI0036E68AC0